MADNQWVEVYRASNAVQAHIVAGALESAGIQVQIYGEALEAGVGVLPPGWATSPKIMVPEGEVEEARRIIAESESGSLAAEDEAEEGTNDEDAAS